MPPTDWFFCREMGCRKPAGQFAPRLDEPSFVRNWLTSSKTDNFRMAEMRRLLAAEKWMGDLSRLSNDAVIGKIAELLVTRRLHIHCPVAAEKAASGSAAAPDSKKSESFVAFPLSERSQKSSKGTAAANDPDTFSPDTNQSQQAATLVAAAQSGTPFCAMCEKARTGAA